MTTDNRTEINDCDATTGFTGDGTTPSTDSTVGFVYEGTNSISTQHSNTDEHMYTTENSVGGGTFSVDWSDVTLYLILKDNLVETTANGGVQIVIGDGTDRVGFGSGGNDDTGIQLDVFWNSYKYDTTTTAPYTNTYAGVLGNLTLTAATQVGIGTVHLAKAQGNVDNIKLDRITYLANGSYGFTINGGTALTPETMTDVVGDSITNGWGAFSNPVGAVYNFFAPTEWGEPAANADVYFTATDEQWFWIGGVVGATHFPFRIVGNATDTIDIKWTNVVIVNTGTDAEFIMGDANVNVMQLDTVSFTDLGAITCTTQSVGSRFLVDVVFNNCGQITVSTIDMDSITVNGSSNADGAFLLDENQSGTQNITGVVFNSDGTGHAIEIAPTGAGPFTYNFDNWTFNDYATDVGTATDRVVYINPATSTANITINVLNNGDTPSVREAAGYTGTVTINNPQNIDFNGVSRGTSLKVISEQTVGTITRGDVLLEAFADANGEATDSLNYEAAFNPDGLLVRAQARNQGIFCSCQVEDNGTGFTDETSDLNSSTTSDVLIWPATPAVNDAIYFGHDATFGRMKTVIGTARSGPTTLTTVWEYWNGLSWQTVTVDEDGVTDWDTVGTFRYTITGSTTGWATTTVNSIGGLYWIRNRITALTGAFTTVPALSRASHDGDRYLPFDSVRRFLSTGLTVTAAWNLDTISEFDPADS